MNKLYCLLLAIMACMDGFSQHRIAVIGSSTAAGVGASVKDSGWVRRFNYYYKYQLGIVDTTYQLAIGGYPVYKGMPTYYVPPPNREGPDPNNNVSKAVIGLGDLPIPANGVVIINYPSNGYDYFSIEEIMFCLQTIYDSVVRKGHRCFIVTTQPRSGPPFGTPELKRKLAIIKDSTILRFGTEHTLNFYDGMYDPADTTLLMKYNSGDGIHLNDLGHKVLFERAKAKNVFGLALPVKLHQFDALLRDQKISLQWTAENTDPATSYTVQRSRDGVQFENLQTIPAGNKSGRQQYDYLDRQPLPDLNYYRLEINEPSSRFYSRVLTVKNPLPGITIKRLYPVPVQRTLNVEVDAMLPYAATLTILTSTGATLQRFSRSINKGHTLLALPVDYLPAGHYFLQVQYRGGQSILQTFSK